LIRRDPDWSDVGAEIERSWRKARRRPWAIAGLTAFFAMAAAGLSARRPVRHQAQITVRLTDPDRREAARAAWTDRALRGYVTEVAFSQSNLLRLMQAYRGPARARSGFAPTGGSVRTPVSMPVADIEALRERIEIEVVQNHAIGLMDPADRPRSAHVIIRFSHADRERALSVAKSLAALVASTHADEHQRQLRHAAEQARDTALAARTWVTRSVAVGLEDVALSGRQVGALEDAWRDAELRASREESGRGMEVEVQDPVIASSPAPLRRRVFVAGTCGALLGTPLAVLLLGALDRRVASHADVRRLGLTCVGQFDLDARRPGPRRGGAA
jgi:hypothetical protein